MADRAAAVRYYFDEDVLGLAKVVAALRPDVTFPGDPGATIFRRTRPPCPIPRGTKDRDWIPSVAEAGWLVVTRDSAIQRRRAEIAAVRESGARVVAISGPDAGGTWQQLEVLMRNWRRIEGWASDDGPFIISVTRAGDPRRVPLG